MVVAQPTLTFGKNKDLFRPIPSGFPDELARYIGRTARCTKLHRILLLTRYIPRRLILITPICATVPSCALATIGLRNAPLTTIRSRQSLPPGLCRGAESIPLVSGHASFRISLDRRFIAQDREVIELVKQPGLKDATAAVMLIDDACDNAGLRWYFQLKAMSTLARKTARSDGASAGWAGDAEVEKLKDVSRDSEFVQLRVSPG